MEAFAGHHIHLAADLLVQDAMHAGEIEQRELEYLQTRRGRCPVAAGHRAEEVHSRDAARLEHVGAGGDLDDGGGPVHPWITSESHRFRSMSGGEISGGEIGMDN
jgi:hypothetical protein